jgi:hypothetical protein
MKNIEELRKELCEAYMWVKDDPRRAAQVKEMSNTAGKIISSIQVELKNALQRKEKPEIAFLQKDQ